MTYTQKPCSYKTYEAELEQTKSIFSCLNDFKIGFPFFFSLSRISFTAAG
jgi:hypothetical protein